MSARKGQGRARSGRNYFGIRQNPSGRLGVTAADVEPAPASPWRADKFTRRAFTRRLPTQNQGSCLTERNRQMLWSRRTSRATAAARRLQSVRPENRIPRATRRESSPTMSPVAESMESRLLLTTYYVNATGGNDSINDGKSDAQAWATLQRAAPPERCLRRRALRLRRPGQAAAAALLRSHLSGHVLGQGKGFGLM